MIMDNYTRIFSPYMRVGLLFQNVANIGGPTLNICFNSDYVLLMAYNMFQALLE